MARNKVTIPFNTEYMTVNQIKQVLGSMTAMLNAAHEMRDSYRDESAEAFLLRCEDFFWKFQTVTQNMTTYSIEEKEKQDA